jgi:rhodanese-related sulfurtransferase
MNKGFYYLAPAMLILALGLVLLPARKNIKELPPRQLLSEINDQTRFLSTDEVAKVIIDKDPFYLLVDVRNARDYMAFSLENAVNIPLSEVLQPKNIDEFGRGNRRIVLFCNGDILSEQAWLILRRNGMKNVFVMKGGLNEWFNTIINPVEPLPTASKSDFDQYRTRLAAAQFFTGSGQALPPKATADPAPKAKIKLQTVPKATSTEGGC